MAEPVEPAYEVYAPTAPSAAGADRTGEPLSELSGKTIGLLWDWYFKGDEIFELLKAELTSRHPDITFVGPEIFGSTHGDGEDEVIAELSELLRAHKCDAVISAVGA